jgi:sporulation protein YlmC with PRC-barrel domain
MIKSLMIALMASALIVFTAGAALAAGGSGPAQMNESFATMGQSHTSAIFQQSQRLSKLIGADVTNKNGDALGTVNDIVAAADGHISYIVVARGGMLGMGEKLVAVPVADVPMSLSKDGTCILDINKTAFDKAPSFASNEWPNLADRQWQNKARGYFGNGKAASPQAKPSQPTENKDSGY